MKNMKVSFKLIIGFSIVAVLAAAVGGAGIIGMKSMEAATIDIYDNQTQPFIYLSTIVETFQCVRVNMREYAIGTAVNDIDRIERAHTDIEEDNRALEEYFDLYSPTIKNPEAIRAFGEAIEIFENKYQDYIQKSYEYAKAGDMNGILDVLAKAKTDMETIVANLDKCVEIQISEAGTAVGNVSTTAGTILTIIIIILTVTVAVALFLGFYISGIISKPLMILTGFMKKASETGDITLRQEDVENIGKLSQAKDEIGKCIGSCARFVMRLTDVDKALNTVANGDITFELALLSDSDTMGHSVLKMMNNLNNMFGEISASTSQVAEGSRQIAEGAQALAQGSTQQAAAAEQLSNAISEIAKKTNDNTNMAGRAAVLANTIKSSAEKGSGQMNEMIAAVKDINQASLEINKVIKVIDDIAFQTNILALNAAVEAAHAGQQGKGFAVVAGEVRSLAAKSAEAAKDTGNLIANSMEKAELGARIANETAASFAEIVSGVKESSLLAGEIAKLSEEQSTGITQINNGISQVAQVVQQNSSTAEESAAASEEMSEQADILKELVSRFKIKNGGTAQTSRLSDLKFAQRKINMSKKPVYTPSRDKSGYGKY